MRCFRPLLVIVTIIAVLCGAPREGYSRLSEPDVVYFGMLTGGNVGNFIKLKLDADGSTLASAVLDNNLGFVLRVPMDSIEPRVPGTARSGDSASLYLGEQAIRTVVIPSRGSLVDLALSATAPTEADWNALYPGDAGNGDINRNGINDLQDFLNGNDPAACIWTDVDYSHRETRVYHARVLRNCLAEAQSDGRHNLIKVAAGTYYGNFVYVAGMSEEFDLRLIGGYDPAGTATSGNRLTTEPTETVLVGDADRDESRNGRVLDISAGAGQTVSVVRVEGFRIIYGGTEWNSATDRYAADGLQGGGMRVQTDKANLELVGNMFSDNFAFVGGALQLSATGAGSILLTGNIISNNAAFTAGAVKISSTGSGAITLLNNTIVDNWAENEGEGDSVLIESLTAPVDLTNNIIRGVEVGSSDIALLRKGADSFPLTVRRNNILSASQFMTDVAGFVLDDGNITASPLFIKQQTNAFYYFPTDGNYRLLASSPGIDSGFPHQQLPAADADGRERVIGAAVDIGAYERPLTDDRFYLSPAALIDPIVHTELIADGFVNRVLVTNLTAYTINGRIQGPEAVSSLTVSLDIDGVATPWETIPLLADNSFSFSPALTPGPNWLHFEITKADNAKVTFWYLILVDTAPPAAILSSAAPPRTNSSPLPVRVTFSKNVSGFFAADVVVTNGVITPASFSGSKAEYLFSVTPTADGTVTVDVPAGVAVDAAGNDNQTAVQLSRIYDTTPPAVILSSSLPSATYVNPIPVTVAFSEPVTAFDQTKLVVSNAAVDSFSGVGGIYTFNLVPTAQNVKVTVDVAAGAVRDMAGNSSSAATQLVRNYAPPIVILPDLPKTTVSLPAGSYNKTIALTMTATENAVIYYTLDGSAPSIGSSRYSGETITVATTTTLRYFSVDSAGNREEPVVSVYVIDNTLPLLTLSTLADGKVTNNATLNISGVVGDNDGIKEVSINGSIVTVGAAGSFSSALALQAGANIIVTKVTDLAGNEVSDTRTIVLDQHATALVIETPADNGVSALSISEISGTTEENAVVLVKVNGHPGENVIMTGNRFVATAYLAAGANTIEITATNSAGTVTTAKRSVFYDNQKPTLAIVEPNQDIRTNKMSMLVKGTVADSQTDVTVTVNDVVVIVGVDGSFERLIELSEQKSYPVIVKAKDVAGNETLVQRNIIHDTTAPVFTVSVLTPTNDRSQTITGSRESGTIIAVVCPTATVAAVTYPTEESWSVAISGFASGRNQIKVTGVDAAGNSTLHTAEIVVGNYYNGPKTITFDAPEGMTIYYTTDGSIPTTGSQKYSGSITLNETTTFSYFAVDGLGNRSQVTMAVYTIDTIVPELIITAPADGTTTASGVLPIGGKVADNTRVAGLTINNVPVPFAADGSFATSLLLHGGANTITSVATDIVGNRKTDTRTIYFDAPVDKVPPTLTVSTLSTNAATNVSPLNITGTVTDASGIALLTINGVSVEIDANGAYSYALPLAAEGVVDITVVAADNAGNQTAAHRTIRYDVTLPALVVTAPADNSRTNDATLSVTGTVSESSTVTITNTTSNITRPATPNGNNFSGSIQLVTGSNTIEITATDAAGNRTTSSKRTILYDPNSPQLAVTDPPHDIQLHSSAVTIKGVVSDQANISVKLTFNGTDYQQTVTAGQFEQDISIPAEGSYPVTVSATTGTVGSLPTIVTRNIIYTPSPADINGDGATTGLVEVLKALQYVYGLKDLTATEKLRLDCAPLGIDGKPNPNGVVDTADVGLLLRRAVGLAVW